MPTVSRGLIRWLFYSGAIVEDFADRLNHIWTFGLFLILGAVISGWHGYQEPITCWCPAEFSDSMVAYTQKTCWHSGSVYRLPSYGPSYLRGRVDKTFYQWVPIILCLQGLLFKIPHISLQILHGFSGIGFEKLTGLTAGYQYLDMADRQKLANQISCYIYRWCKMFPRCLPWRLLTAVWFLVKCMYCVNIVCQMKYTNSFLKPVDVSTSYGVNIYNIINNNASLWKPSPVFPQRILCDFNVRQFKHVHRYTVQCYLNGNRFTEYAYMFLWLWLVFVTMVTVVSFAVWIVLRLIPIFRKRYIRRLMEVTEEQNMVSDQDVSCVTSIVGEDGVFVLKLIGANSSELLVRDIVYGISKMAHCGAFTSQRSGQILQYPPAADPTTSSFTPLNIQS